MPHTKVLLVEDDDQDAYITSLAVADSLPDSKVTRACNGQEAIRLIASGDLAPDLAVVDLNMPILDGHELLTFFASRTPRTFPVVVLSTASAWESQASSLLRGASRFIPKSDDVKAIGRELKAALDEMIISGWLQCESAGAPDALSLSSHDPHSLLIC